MGGLCPHPKRSLIRSELINGMCNFEDGTRAAAAASHCSNCVVAVSIAQSSFRA